jgi:hypothetical protein
MMTLREAIQRINTFDGDHGFYVAAHESLCADTAVAVFEISEDQFRKPATEMKLLIDVWDAAEVLKGLEQLLNRQLERWPNQEEVLHRFIIYLKNDA